MALLCIVLFLVLQVSYVVASRNVLNYAAVATARSETVGLNDFMLYKVSHYTSIPTAGAITAPVGDFSTDRPEGTSLGEQWDNSISRDKLPESKLGPYIVGIREAFHLSSPVDLPITLGFVNWDPGGEADVHVSATEVESDRLLQMTIEQQVPLTLPFAHAFFPNLPTVKVIRNNRTETYPGKDISATSYIENHSKYYLVPTTTYDVSL